MKSGWLIATRPTAILRHCRKTQLITWNSYCDITCALIYIPVCQIAPFAKELSRSLVSKYG